jgi:hypothetical protein
MLPYLMPNDSTANWAPSANLSAREVPITMQLPDWNMWLPGVHPIDSWGSSFTSSQLFTNYKTIRANLIPNNPTSYQAQSFNIWNWPQLDHFGFLQTELKPTSDPAWSNPAYAASIFSLEAWSMTKNWEINQEFGLEGMSQVVFGPLADSRAWFSPLPFFLSPNMIGAPTSALGNGSAGGFLYMSMVWYQVQLILNYSNNRGNTHLSQSADWPYTYNHLDAFGYTMSPPAPSGLLTTLWLIKGLQASQNGNGPQLGSAGWSPTVNPIWRLVSYGTPKWDPALPPATRTAIMNAYTQLWLAGTTSYTPQDYYTGGWTTASTIPNPAWPDQGWANNIAYTIPQLEYYGVSSTLTNQIIAWAQTMWPGYNWSALSTPVCVTTPQTLFAPTCTP